MKIYRENGGCVNVPEPEAYEQRLRNYKEKMDNELLKSLERGEKTAEEYIREQLRHLESSQKDVQDSIYRSRLPRTKLVPGWLKRKHCKWLVETNISISAVIAELTAQLEDISRYQKAEESKKQ